MKSETGIGLPHRSGGIGKLLRALGIVGFIVAAMFLPATGIGASGESQSDSSSNIAENVMAELRAATEARRKMLVETQAWKIEKEKLELLKAAVKQEAAQLRTDTETDRREITHILDNRSAAQMQRQKMRQMEIMLDALSEKLEDDLDALSKRHFPGIVTSDKSASSTDPLQRFFAATRRLQEASKNSKQVCIEIVEGRLANTALTVKLLRAGTAAAWWVALDGKRGGIAQRSAKGELILNSITDKNVLEEIKRTFGMAEGFAAPEWTLLPLPAKQSEARP